MRLWAFREEGKCAYMGVFGSAARLSSLALSAPAGAARPAYSPSTILVKFANPAKAAAIVRSLGDRPLGLTLNRVEVVGLDRGESVTKKVARYRKP